MQFANQPDWVTMRKMGMKPDQILRDLGMLQPPIDIRAAAQRLGISVREVPSPGWTGAVNSDPSGIATIWVPLDDIEVRKRFTIAHEIAHLMLHPVGTQFRDTNFQGSPTERAANRFAADMLMPVWLIHPAALSLGSDVRRLAELFNVSNQAMGYRLDSLGLIHG
jgi:predicted transcriptional regulator